MSGVLTRQRQSAIEAYENNEIQGMDLTQWVNLVRDVGGNIQRAISRYRNNREHEQHRQHMQHLTDQLDRTSRMRAQMRDNSNTPEPGTAAPTTEPPLSNPPDPAQVMNTATHISPGGETALDPIIDEIYRPFKTSVNTVLKYVSPHRHVGAVAANGYAAALIRLNSIHDIEVLDTAFVSDPTAAADVAQAIGYQQKPNLFSYWTTFYEYYCVTKVDYKITFWNSQVTLEPKNNATPDTKMVIFKYMTGQQLAPYVDTNPVTPEILYEFQRDLHGPVEKKYLSTVTAFNQMSTHENKVEFTGTYVAGTLQHEICEDELTKTWTKTNATPPQKERLQFIINHSDFSRQFKNNGGTTVVTPLPAWNMFYTIEMNMHVQFKDLKRQWLFPTGSDDFPAILHYNDMTWGTLGM